MNINTTQQCASKSQKTGHIAAFADEKAQKTHTPAPAVKPAVAPQADIAQPKAVPQAVSEENSSRTAVVAPEATVSDMTHISADLMALAMKVIQGQIPTFVVTQEMVGSRVAVDEDKFYIFDAPDKPDGAPSSVSSNSPAEKAPLSKSKSEGDHTSAAPAERLRKKIVEIVSQYEEPLLVSEIITLLPDNLKADTSNRTRARVNRQIARIIGSNELTRKRNQAGSWLYGPA